MNWGHLPQGTRGVKAFPMWGRKQTDLIVLPGEPLIEVHLRRSSRARRLSLRVGRSDGRVTLSMPRSAPLQEARAFAEAKADWIRSHLSRVPAVKRPRIGGHVPLFGQDIPIEAGATRVARFTGEKVIVPDDAAKVSARTKVLLQTLARTHLTEATERYASMVGRPFGKITLRDTRSRWGSCTSRGDLMYSWRLVMAPKEVLDYVAAHEVSHLVHMDHSARFWGQVAELMPDYAQHRAWLTRQGADLLGWDFKAGGADATNR